MRLFVTGICGELGRAIACETAKQDIEVIGLDLRPWPNSYDLPGNVQTIVGSYEDIELVERLLDRCDAIIHTAGPNGAHIGKVDLSGFLHLNVTCVARLLEAAIQANVNRVVLSSTMEVYVGQNCTQSGAAIIDEESVPVPDSPYSLSRLLAEQLGQMIAEQQGVSVVSLRYMAFSSGEPLGPRQLARALSPRDAARAAILAASNNGFVGDVIHIGPQTPLTNADIIAAFTDPHAVVEKYFPGASDILSQQNVELTSANFWPVTSIRRAQRLLGWTPHDTFELWLKEHGWQQQSGPGHEVVNMNP